MPLTSQRELETLWSHNLAQETSVLTAKKLKGGSVHEVSRFSWAYLDWEEAGVMYKVFIVV